MQTATAPRTLKIDGMTGDACVQKVKTALGNVSGVTTNSVQVGSAAITCDQSQCEAASAAVNTAGYKNTLSASTNAAAPGAAPKSDGHQSGGSNGTPKSSNPAPATQASQPEVKPVIPAPTA